MLFKKKICFSVTEKQIKRTLYSDTKTPLVVINLRYPQINCEKSHPLSKTAVKLYPSVAQGFCDYAKQSLVAAANQSYAQAQGKFSPFGAILQWKNSFEDENFLSIMLKFSVVTNEKASHRTETQVWNKAKGTKCLITDIITKEQRDRLIKEHPDRKADIKSQRFLLCPHGLEIVSDTRQSLVFTL